MYVVESGAQITRFPLSVSFFLLGARHAQKGGQEWARRLETKEVAKIAAEEAKERDGVKKDQ